MHLYTDAGSPPARQRSSFVGLPDEKSGLCKTGLGGLIGSHSDLVCLRIHVEVTFVSCYATSLLGLKDGCNWRIYESRGDLSHDNGR